AAAALLLLAARRARGRTILADAALPLILMHPRHAVNVLWGWQFQFVVSTALACVVLARIARGARDPARSELLVASSALLLLPLCGANGLALVPALALWFVWLALEARRAPAAARALVAVAPAGPVLAGLYFVGLEHVPNYALSSSWSSALEEALRFFAA